MSRKSVELVGCTRYNYKGELFERGPKYNLSGDRVDELCRIVDSWGRAFFRVVDSDAAAEAAPAVEAKGKKASGGDKVAAPKKPGVVEV